MKKTLLFSLLIFCASFIYAQITPQISSSTNPSCYGSCDGLATVLCTDGTGPYSFQWDSSANSQTSQTAINLCAGTYIVTVTDALSVTGEAVAVIDQPEMIHIEKNLFETCPESCNGSAEAYVSGGISPYTYNWSSSDTTYSAINLCAGTYELIVTDYNGCVKNSGAIQINEKAPMSLALFATNPSCSNSYNGNIDLTVIGGSYPYTFSWSNSSATEDIFYLGAGWYFVTVTDNSDCQLVDSVEITEPSAVGGTFINSNPSCFGIENGSSDLTPSGGTPPYSFNWSNGHTSEDLSNVSGGYYNVTITDSKGCYYYDMASLNDPPQISLYPSSIPSSCGQATGMAIIGASSGVPPYSYNWSNGSSIDSVPNLSAGSYVVTVTDNAGCQKISNVDVNDISGPSVTIDYLSNVSCFGDCNGQIGIFTNGGVSPYTYTWSNGDSQPSVYNLCHGMYTVSAQDAVGCIGVLSLEIGQPDELKSNMTFGNPSCAGLSNGWVDASPVGGTWSMSWAWNDPAASTNEYVPDLAPGNYSVTITDANGCTVMDSIELFEPPVLTSSITGFGAGCYGSNGGSADLTVDGGSPPYSPYSWSGPASFSSNAEDINGLVSGMYYVTAYDYFGCQISDSIFINQPTQLVVSMIGTNPICFGGSDGSIDVTVSGGVAPYTYSWNGGETSEDPINLSSGYYEVTVYDANGCQAVNYTNLYDPSAMSFLPNHTKPSCGSLNGSASISNGTGGTSPYYYLWSTASTSSSIIAVGAGSYSVTVNDVNGCTVDYHFDLSNSAGPMVTLNYSMPPLCNGGSSGGININVTSGTQPYTYSWTSGQLTEDIIGIPAGNYTVTVTDYSGCKGVFTSSINDPEAINVNFNISNPYCFGGANGNISANVVGGISPYTYSWNTLETTQNIGPHPAGAYGFTVTDYNGCVKSSIATIVDPPKIIFDSIVNHGITCNGLNNGSLKIYISGGTSPYIYSINSGGTWNGNSQFWNLPPNSYSIVVKDNLACMSSTVGEIIAEPAQLVGIPSFSNVTCAWLDDGSASVLASGGTSPYSYYWSGGESTSSISNLFAGTYTVTVKDVNFCEVIKTVIINQPPEMTSSISSVNVSCNGANNGSAIITTNGGTPAYSFLWSTGGNTSIESNLAMGDYGITVSDLNGCQIIDSVSIIEPAMITIFNTVTDPSCNASSDGAIDITVIGGIFPYTFSWSNSSSSEDQSGLGAGPYDVTVTDNIGCTADDIYNLNDPDPLSLNGSTTYATCNGASDGTISLSITGGTAPFSIVWYPGGMTTQNLVGLAAGSYDVTVTDANLCEALANITVNEPALLTATVSPVDASCFGVCDGTMIANPAGGTSPYYFLWDIAAAAQTTQTANNLCAGNYEVTVSDANGCNTAVLSSIGQGAEIFLTPSATDAPCGASTGTTFVSASGGAGGFSFDWYPDGYTNEFTSGYNDLPAGTYNVTVVDANGCLATTSAIVNNVGGPTSTHTFTDVSCNGGSDGTATVNATGGTPSYSYSWSSGGNTATEINLSAGTYTVTVSDAISCNSIQSVIISEPTALSLTFNTVNPACDGGTDGSATAMVSGGTTNYGYLWGSNAGSQTTPTVTGLADGIYGVTINDANGCSISGNATITAPLPLTATDIYNNVTCFGGSDGAIDITPVGGTSPFSYSWSNGASTEDLSSLLAGSYDFTITDNNLCQATRSFTISQPGAIVVTGVVGNEACGQGDGVASVTASGGSGSFSYDWMPDGYTNDYTSTYSGLPAGTYSVTVADASGCTIDTSLVVGSISGPTASISSNTNVSCTGGSNGAATVDAIGGVTPYTIIWSSGGTSTTETNLAAGDYGVTVYDYNGCQSIDSVVITEPIGLSGTLSSTNPTCSGGSNGSAVISISGGNAPYSYLWDANAGDQSTATAIGLASGSFGITVTDASGCQINDIAALTDPGLLSMTEVITGVTCNGGANGTIDLTPLGGTSPYFFSWSNGASTEDLTGLVMGNYDVTISDVNFCQATGSFTVIAPIDIIISEIVVSETCGGNSDGAIDLTVTGGTAPYSYELTGPNGFLSYNEDNYSLLPGDYLLTLTDAAGCITNKNFTVLPGVIINISEITSNVTCFGDNNGAIDLSVSGGNSPYSYSWDSGSSSEDLSSLASGGYSVTVTDLSFCSVTGDYNIAEPGLINLSTTVTDESCQGSSNGAVSLTIGGGVSPFVFSWTGPSGFSSGSQNITNLPVGDAYTVVVTDTEGCTAETSANILAGPSVTVSAASDQVVCANNANVNLNGSVTNASGGIWSSSGSGAFVPNNLTLSAIYIPSPADVLTGTVNILLTSTGNGACSPVNDEMIVTFNAAPTVNAGADITSCESNTTVTLNGTSSTGSSIWSTNGSGFFDNSSLPNANYAASLADLTTGVVILTLSSTNNGFCQTVLDNITISYTPAPIVNAGSDLTVCEISPSIALAGSLTNATNAIWSTTGTGFFNNDTSLNAVFTLSGADVAIGQVEVILSSTGNGNCLMVQDTMVITVNPSMTLSVSSTDITCFGGNNGSASVVASSGQPPYSYLWENGATTATVNGLDTDMYTVVVSDAYSCTATDSVEVFEPQDILLSYTVSNVTCNGDANGSIDLAVTGGIPPYTYLWTTGSQIEDPTNLVAASYNVTVTDVGMCTATITVVVTQPSVLTVTISSYTNVSCNGSSNGEATAVGSGGLSPYFYEWPGLITGSVINGLSIGNYEVTVTDNNSCTATTNVLITAPSGINITSNYITNVNCNGLANGEISVSANGGTGLFSYAWSSGGNASIESGLTAGTYSVTVTDDNSCTSSVSYPVTQPAVLAASIASVTNISCFGGNDGTAIVAVTGGTTPYSYAWPSGGNQSVETGLAANLYQVTVTDYNGCEAFSYAILAQPAVLTSSVTPSYVNCFGETNGSVAALANGGTVPYTYLWSNGSSQSIQSNLPAGSYNVSITDAHGCQTAASSSILEPDELLINLSQSNVACFGNNSGSVITSVVGGSPSYSYSWSNGQISNSIYGIIAGVYTLTVTDQHGCQQSESVTISQPSAIEAVNGVTNSSCITNSNGAIDLSVSGGNSPYSFVWSGGETTEDISDVLAGEYSVTITDFNGCLLTSSIEVGITFTTSIFGIVSDAGNALTAGSANVELYSEIASSGPGYALISSIPIDGSGSYNFTDLPPDSTYYLKAVLVNYIAYPTLMTTYYDTTYAYLDATPINIGCDDNLNINIEMLNSPAPLLTGGAYVSGTITYNDIAGNKEMGDPVPGAEIYIEQEPGDEPIANTETDTAGYYEFSHVPSGYTYSLYVDIPGLPLISTHTFEVNGQDTISNNLDFHVDTTGSGGIWMVEGSFVEEIEIPDLVVNMYPNPYRNFINIEYVLNRKGDVNIEVFDAIGKKVVILENGKQLEGEYKYTFTSKDYGMLPGVYYVKMNVNNHTFIKRIIEIE